MDRYCTIRFDQVHYCPREQQLRKKRNKRGRRKSFRHHTAEDDYVYNSSTDPSIARLKLLTNTLAANPQLARMVRYIKLPSLLRDSRKMDIAQLVHQCPNLLYVDLPAGFYNGDHSTDIIRKELRANCPDLRVMKYLGGAISHFEDLAKGSYWQNLEIIELEGLQLDTRNFRKGMVKHHALKNLVLKDLGFSDDIFVNSTPAESTEAYGFATVATTLPQFPAIPSLELHNMRGITATGVNQYLLNSLVQSRLQSLTLSNTGVEITGLHEILKNARNLQSLAFVRTVHQALPLQQPPPLRSESLQTLHYEIKNSVTITTSPLPTESYHDYLLSSILDNGLPALRALYVREPSFPEKLLKGSQEIASRRNSMSSNRNSMVNSSRNSFTSIGSHSPNPQEDANSAFSSAFSAAHFGLGPPTSAAITRSPIFPPSPRLLSPPTSHSPSPGSPAFLHQDPFKKGAISRLRQQQQQQQQALIARSRRRLLTHPLEVFTKPQHDNISSWLSQPLDPSPPPGAAPRPTSTFNVEWGARARRSVIFTDVEGNFVPVPVPETELLPSRPQTSHSFKSFRSERPMSVAEERWRGEEGEVERKRGKRRSGFRPARVGNLW
jgi:hypothetical protein